MFRVSETRVERKVVDVKSVGNVEIVKMVEMVELAICRGLRGVWRLGRHALNDCAIIGCNNRVDNPTAGMITSD